MNRKMHQAGIEAFEDFLLKNGCLYKKVARKPGAGTLYQRVFKMSEPPSSEIDMDAAAEVIKEAFTKNPGGLPDGTYVLKTQPEENKPVEEDGPGIAVNRGDLIQLHDALLESLQIINQLYPCVDDDVPF